jgi:hypothetical protein
MNKFSTAICVARSMLDHLKREPLAPDADDDR